VEHEDALHFKGEGGKGEALEYPPLLGEVEGLSPSWFYIVDQLNMPLSIAELLFVCVSAESMPPLLIIVTY
jgi:hypothetical protein